MTSFTKNIAFAATLSLTAALELSWGEDYWDRHYDIPEGTKWKPVWHVGTKHLGYYAWTWRDKSVIYGGCNQSVFQNAPEFRG